jgi:hypothetical protein
VTRVNGHANDDPSAVVQQPLADDILNDLPIPPVLPGSPPEPATRAKQRATRQIQQNRFVIIAAGVIVTALLVFVAVSMPGRGSVPRKPKIPGATTEQLNTDGSDTASDRSLFPIIDSGRPADKEDHQGFLSERDLQRTAIRKAPITSPAGPTDAAGALGSIAPFGDQAWQAPPYHPGATIDASEPDKTERDAMEKSSLIYVRNVSVGANAPQTRNSAVPGVELGLATGTRLRARLESSASTAVRTPVLAVIEYNYEQNGEIVVPAGAKAVGHIRDANRSGYVDIEFDSLLLPDGDSVAIEAAATDLSLRPLKGKVEGKNTGKNVFVRSLSGIGQAGSLLVGQGSLNQPLSESDLMRERVSSNIGEAGDEAISRLAATQHIVVTVSAGIPIYVVLQQASKSNLPHSPGRSAPASTSASVEQVRQLLQLQQELSEPTGSPSDQ